MIKFFPSRLSFILFLIISLFVFKNTLAQTALEKPINPDPEDNGNFLTSERYLRWGGVWGANFYQYKVDYEGVEKIPPTIVFINCAILPVGEMELGEYTWYVQACLDDGCQEASGFAGPWHFNLVQPSECTGEEGGLVPCNRYCDNPDTPWNERNPCGFEHLFLMIKNIIDFLLWRVGLIVLVLLVLATGVIYYFSMGAPGTMARVKSLLQTAGRGYAILFLGWIFITLLLSILGFQVNLFGQWWQISF